MEFVRSVKAIAVERRWLVSVTQVDVASAAGVSRALVSIVMRDVPGASDATRARVRQAADAIGYRPDPRARRLRQLRTKLIGVTFAAAQEFNA